MDKYYQKAYSFLKELNILNESGYLNNDHEEKYYYDNIDKKFLLNTDNIYQYIKSFDDVPVGEINIILTTGCFAPLHQGHLQMLEHARETIEQETGERVIQGYIALDNDSYVQQKTSMYSTIDRVQYAESLISTKEWLNIDYWTSYHVSENVNFTTVYEHLKNYLEYQYPDNIFKIWYVFGSDHYLYANAFSEHGNAICIKRGGYDQEYKKEHLFPNIHKRVIFSSMPSTIEESSTRIRNNKNLSNIKPREQHGNKLWIRNDIKESLQDSNIILNTHLNIYHELLEILRDYYPKDINFHNNEERIKTLIHTHEKGLLKYPVISLDNFFQGDYNIDISRVFGLDGQYVNKGYIERLESEISLDEQCSIIPSGDYIILDDDIATGETVKNITMMLKKYKVNIQGTLCLIPEDSDSYDIIDARDFIIGSKYGGLTIDYHNSYLRLPYMYPYVNLTTRAKIDTDKTLKLSLKLWEFNKKLYSEHFTNKNGNLLRIKDLKYNYFKSINDFDENMLIIDYCDYHIKMIKKIIHNHS